MNSEHVHLIVHTTPENHFCVRQLFLLSVQRMHVCWSASAAYLRLRTGNIAGRSHEVNVVKTETHSNDRKIHTRLILCSLCSICINGAWFPFTQLIVGQPSMACAKCDCVISSRLRARFRSQTANEATKPRSSKCSRPWYTVIHVNFTMLLTTNFFE